MASGPQKAHSDDHPNLVHSHCVLKSLDIQANGIVDFEYCLTRLLLHASFPPRPELGNEFIRQWPLSVNESGADVAHGIRHRACPIAIAHRPDRQALEALDADAADEIPYTINSSAVAFNNRREFLHLHLGGEDRWVRHLLSVHYRGRCQHIKVQESDK